MHLELVSYHNPEFIPRLTIRMCSLNPIFLFNEWDIVAKTSVTASMAKLRIADCLNEVQCEYSSSEVCFLFLLPLYESRVDFFTIMCREIPFTFIVSIS